MLGSSTKGVKPDANSKGDKYGGICRAFVSYGIKGEAIEASVSGQRKSDSCKTAEVSASTVSERNDGVESPSGGR